MWRESKNELLRSQQGLCQAGANHSRRRRQVIKEIITIIQSHHITLRLTIGKVKNDLDLVLSNKHSYSIKFSEAPINQITSQSWNY